MLHIVIARSFIFFVIYLIKKQISWNARIITNFYNIFITGSIPTILQNPLNNTVIKNEPVTLDCRASGSPIPVIEWFKDGQLVATAPADASSHRILLPDGSLFFLRAMQNKKEQDAGTYWCVASNTEGVARSSNATLDIACKFTSSMIDNFSLYRLVWNVLTICCVSLAMKNEENFLLAWYIM